MSSISNGNAEPAAGAQLSGSGQSGLPGGKGKSNRISLCMMVKDEEKNLPRLLKSIAPFVDEIIVVDTGSSDRTMEIAREYGAKIYEHPWTGDFSAHRNQSIQYASGDWILILDADEEMDADSAPLLRPAVQRLPDTVGCVHFEMYNAMKNGQFSMVMHPRLFRNDGHFHYDGRVHNTPRHQGATAKSSIKFYHYGYNLDPETMSRKFERRVEMTRRWVETEPENFVPRAYLAQAYLERAEYWEQAVEQALIGLEMAKKRSDMQDLDYPRLYQPLVTSLARLGRYEECIKYAQECMEIIPVLPDPYYYISYAYMQTGQMEPARDTARRFIELQDEALEHPERFRYMENLTFTETHEALWRWALAAWELGDRAELQEALSRLARHERGESRLQKGLGDNLLNGNYELVSTWGGLVRNAGGDWPWLEKYTALSDDLPNRPDIEGIFQQGIQALQTGDALTAQACLTQVLRKWPGDFRALSGFGAALALDGLWARAQDWLVRGLSANPMQPEVWARLAEVLLEQDKPDDARLCLERLVQIRHQDQQAKQKLAELQAQAHAEPAAETVGQKHPKLILFLVDGLELPEITQASPHFMMHKAWGETLRPSQGLAPGEGAWTGLFTGSGAPADELISGENLTPPFKIGQFKNLTLWELIAKRQSIGLMSIPLIAPAFEINGWCINGHSHGVMESRLSTPDSLDIKLLAAGYRPTRWIEQSVREMQSVKTKEKRVHEGFMFQLERNMLAAVYDLPAVEVLVVGLGLLDTIKYTFGQQPDRVFMAYQMIYGMIESMLAALSPQAFGVFGQSVATDADPQNGNGFYCLSWLHGENGKAPVEAVAQEILKYLDIPLSELGSPRE